MSSGEGRGLNLAFRRWRARVPCWIVLPREKLLCGQPQEVGSGRDGEKRGGREERGKLELTGRCVSGVQWGRVNRPLPSTGNEGSEPRQGYFLLHVRAWHAWPRGGYAPDINLYLTFEISMRPTCSCVESSLGPCFFDVRTLDAM